MRRERKKVIRRGDGIGMKKKEGMKAGKTVGRREKEMQQKEQKGVRL